jgi:hypothetical protein
MRSYILTPSAWPPTIEHLVDHAAGTAGYD